MKKMIVSLALFCLAPCFLCACGKETPLLATEDYILDAESGSTSRGVKVGDDAEAFLAAYQDDMMFSAIGEGEAQTDYQFLPVEEIPFDTATSIILPTFFIDGLPVAMDQFCEDNEIEKADILSYLTDASYLAKHKVIYRYLVFTWKSGVITDIRSESMDYNQDASYYEAN